MSLVSYAKAFLGHVAIKTCFVNSCRFFIHFSRSKRHLFRLFSVKRFFFHRSFSLWLFRVFYVFALTLKNSKTGRYFCFCRSILLYGFLTIVLHEHLFTVHMSLSLCSLCWLRLSAVTIISRRICVRLNPTSI